MSWVEQAELVSSNPKNNANFGNSVSIYGDTAIVGEPFQIFFETNLGKAYIFTRSGTNWLRQAELVPLDPEVRAQFGWSVSIYGDTAIVGAPFKDASGTDSGKAYIFIRDSYGNWSQQAELVPLDPELNAQFGNSVSIYGDTVIVGALLKDASGSDSGKAYIFTRSGTSWTRQAELVPSDPELNALFGFSVSIYGDTVIVGSLLKDTSIFNSGKAYIFTRSGTSWSRQAELVPSDPEIGANFGISVSIYGDTAIVGASRKDASGTDSGKAYIFTRSGTSWSQQAGLIPSDPEADAQFGNSVSIYSDTVIIGAIAADVSGSNSGKAYIFTRLGSSWSQQAALVPSDPEVNSFFGNSVSIYDNKAIIGAFFKDINPTDAGKAYIFGLEQLEPESEEVAELNCLCSQKPCAQLSNVGVTQSDKITNIHDNRTIATSFTLNNIPDNVRGRQFSSFNDYLRYQQAQLKYY